MRASIWIRFLLRRRLTHDEVPQSRNGRRSLPLRLLERMQPQIMEVVNPEVLRPAIEAIVRREMKKN